MSDSWDGDASLPGGGLPLPGLFKLVAPLLNSITPRQVSPLEAVRLRLAALELARHLNGGVLSYRDVGSLDNILKPVRQDWVLLGARGSGKTATGVYIAQFLRKALEVRAVAVGWPAAAAKAVGLESVTKLDGLRDVVAIVDEAGLRVKPGKRDEMLVEAVALARHYGVSLIWTSQGGAGVNRDVLRQDARVAWLRVEPLQARFDREELVDLVSQVVSIQSKEPVWAPGRLVTLDASGWTVAQAGLPEGWSEQVSTLWR